MHRMVVDNMIEQQGRKVAAVVEKGLQHKVHA